MTQVPHITQNHYEKAWSTFSASALVPSAVTVCNKAIEIALAEQATQEQYIRKEVPAEPHAELFYRSAHGWIPWFEGSCVTKNHPSFEWSTKASIDAPTCQVKNLDTSELKTMTREKAKLLHAQTKDVCDWHIEDTPDCWTGSLALFDSGCIYAYKLKANPVKLDGDLMTREAAIEIWESEKDACDLWFKSAVTGCQEFEILDYSDIAWLDHQTKSSEYQLRPKPLKQVSWKDMPVGVMTNKGELRGVYLAGDNTYRICTESKNRDGDTNWSRFITSHVELAPADQQPWIAVQELFTPVNGLLYSFKYDRNSNTPNNQIAAFKVTGIAEGYELK